MLTHEVEKSPKGQSGFTLIELLIVIAIIAILAAIAIPQFLKYKQGAYLDSVRSDVKNTVTAIEAYQATNGIYPDLTTPSDCGPGPATITLGSSNTCTNGASTAAGSDINISSGNYISIAASAVTSCAHGYTVSGYNDNINSGSIGSKGTGTEVSYDSCTGAYSGF